MTRSGNDSWNTSANAYEREQITIAPPEDAGSIIRRLGEATATPAAVDVHVVTNRWFMNTTEYVVRKANWGRPRSLPPSCGDASPSRPCGVEDACETWSTARSAIRVLTSAAPASPPLQGHDDA
jgi:hypothetical protein